MNATRHLSLAAATLLAFSLGGCGRPDSDATPDQSPAGGAPPAGQPSAQTPDSATPESPSWAVDATHAGPVRFGMTVVEAAAAAPGEWPTTTDGCAYGRVTGAPGMGFMIEQGRVVRVDVDSAGPATVDGVGVGAAEDKVRAAYAGRVTEQPHKYNAGGKYLTVTPAAPADSLFRIVFETGGGVVTTYRAGQRPQVEYVERCG
jgi:hypothetical protein